MPFADAAAILGDLEEEYTERCHLMGEKEARRWYRRQVLRSAPAFWQQYIYWGIAMFKNYLTIALRNLRKHKSTSAINIVGLAIGMACCIVILVFVRDELGFDRYHVNGDRIQRLAMTVHSLSSEDTGQSATTSILWGPAMQRDYPEVTDYVRFVGLIDDDNPWTFMREDRAFEETEVLYADPSALTHFSWPLLRGDQATVLTEPSTLVLTESAARKYFGDVDPIGQTLTIDPKLRDDSGSLTGATFDYTVVGVLQDIPRQSHFTFEMLMPFVNLNNIFGGDVTSGENISRWFWRGRMAHTYLVVDPAADLAGLEAKFPAFLDQYVGDETRSRGYYYEPYLQALPDIYLGGEHQGQLRTVGDVNHLYLFGLIAIFILVIACINFTNLATAKSAQRAKEVGMRKAVGADRRQIVHQFLGESVVTSLVAFVLALVLARLMLPVFYGYLNKDFAFDYAENALFLLSLLGVGVGVGVLAGSYPAFFLARFNPVSVLKGLASGKARGGLLRKGLVVFQFTLSATLIVATLTVFSQLRFMQNYDLGFSQDHTLVLPPSVAQSLMPSYEAVKTELLANPDIIDVTASSGLPGMGGSGDVYVEQGKGAEDGISTGEYFVDYNFMELYDIELIAGRTFSRDIPTDAGTYDAEDTQWLRGVSMIVNETLVEQFGWSSPEEAIGKQIIRDPRSVDWTATIIGVVKDFHVESLHEDIRPGGLILMPDAGRARYLSARVQPDAASEALAFIEATVAQFAPDVEFEYTFMDATFAQQYQMEERLTEVFTFIAFLAIFIACLGLFGLAAFMAEQRTKEIGIRKVLGASARDVVVLMTKSFALLVGLAFIIAIPVSYFGMDRWLQEFAYRIDLGPGLYLLTALLVLTIAGLTVGYQALRSALARPADALRYE